MIQDGSIWFMQSPEGGSRFVTFADRNMIVSVSMTDVELYDLLEMKHYRVAFRDSIREHAGVVSDAVFENGSYFPNTETALWMTKGDVEKMLDRMGRALLQRIDSLPEKYQKIWDDGTNIVQTLLIRNPGKKYK